MAPSAKDHSSQNGAGRMVNLPSTSSVSGFTLLFDSFMVISELTFTEKFKLHFPGGNNSFFCRQLWVLFAVVYLFFLSLVALLASLGTCSVLMQQAPRWQPALERGGRALASWEAGEDP